MSEGIKHLFFIFFLFFFEWMRMHRWMYKTLFFFIFNWYECITLYLLYSFLNLIEKECINACIRLYFSFFEWEWMNDWRCLYTSQLVPWGVSGFLGWKLNVYPLDGRFRKCWWLSRLEAEWLSTWRSVPWGVGGFLGWKLNDYPPNGQFREVLVAF